MMETLIENLPIVLPIIVLDLFLVIFSLFHIFRHPHCKIGNKYIWIPVIILVQLFGPILYFVIGRGED